MSYQLTEENIKHATLSFLKTYYKDNSSRGFGNTVATIDMLAGDGIIADGYIKFSIDDDPMAGLSNEEAEKAILNDKIQPKQTKNTFFATFEATSQRTAQEIQYRVQKSLLIFDALAIASIMAAISYGYNFMNDQFTLNQLGTFKFVAGFFGVMVASMIGYLLLFRHLSRYHHIHALAQFKKYHADEQWVSYGEDVFENPSNKYLIELKKQCIRQGFGLISVDQNLQPSLVITPARELKVGTRRKIRNFVEGKTGSKSFKWIDGIKIPNLKSPIDTSDYTRYTKSYWKQGAVVLAMLFVMGEIYLEELKNPNIVFADEKAYQESLIKLGKDTKTEPIDSLVQTEFGLAYSNEINLETKKDRADKKQKNTLKTPTAPKKNTIKPKSSKHDAFIISTGLDGFVSYDCSRLSSLKGLNFLVQISTANSSTEAIRKVKTFSESGFKANAVWLGCFLNNKTYVIYLDNIFNDKNEATERLERYQKLLIAKNQSPTTAVLRAING